VTSNTAAETATPLPRVNVPVVDRAPAVLTSTVPAATLGTISPKFRSAVLEMAMPVVTIAVTFALSEVVFWVP